MKMIVESYYFLFFRLWRWHRKHFGESDLPHLNASLNLGLLLLLNWMTFLLAVRSVLGIQLVSWSKMAGVIVVSIISVALWTVFFRKKRYKQIIEAFNAKGGEVSPIVRIMSIGYPIVTFIAMLLAGFFAWGIDNR